MSLLKMGLDNYPTNSNDYICITNHGRVFNFNENEFRYDLIGQLTSYHDTPVYRVANCVKFGNYILCNQKTASDSAYTVLLFDLTVYNVQQYLPDMWEGYATVDDEYLYSIRNSNQRYIDKWYLDPLDNQMKKHPSSGYSSSNLGDEFISNDDQHIICRVSNTMKFIDKETLTEIYSKPISGLGSKWLNYNDYIIYYFVSSGTNQIGKFVKPGTDNPNPVGNSTILLSKSGSKITDQRFICHIWKDILLYSDGAYNIGIYDLKNSTNIQSPISANNISATWHIQRTYNFDNFIINGYKPNTAYSVVPFGVYGSITSTTPFNSGEYIYCIWKN